MQEEAGGVEDYGPADAMARGREDYKAKKPKVAPPEWRDNPAFSHLAEAYIEGWVMQDEGPLSKPLRRRRSSARWGRAGPPPGAQHRRRQMAVTKKVGGKKIAKKAVKKAAAKKPRRRPPNGPAPVPTPSIGTGRALSIIRTQGTANEPSEHRIHAQARRTG